MPSNVINCISAEARTYKTRPTKLLGARSMPLVSVLPRGEFCTTANNYFEVQKKRFGARWPHSEIKTNQRIISMACIKYQQTAGCRKASIQKKKKYRRGNYGLDVEHSSLNAPSAAAGGGLGSGPDAPPACAASHRRRDNHYHHHPAESRPSSVPATTLPHARTPMGWRAIVRVHHDAARCSTGTVSPWNSPWNGAWTSLSLVGTT